MGTWFHLCLSPEVGTWFHLGLPPNTTDVWVSAIAGSTTTKTTLFHPFSAVPLVKAEVKMTDVCCRSEEDGGLEQRDELQSIVHGCPQISCPLKPDPLPLSSSAHLQVSYTPPRSALALSILRNARVQARARTHTHTRTRARARTHIHKVSLSQKVECVLEAGGVQASERERERERERIAFSFHKDCSLGSVKLD